MSSRSQGFILQTFRQQIAESIQDSTPARTSPVAPAHGCTPGTVEAEGSSSSWQSLNTKNPEKNPSWIKAASLLGGHWGRVLRKFKGVWFSELRAPGVPGQCPETSHSEEETPKSRNEGAVGVYRLGGGGF